MILSPENISYILGVCGLLAIIFSVYNSFKNPQIKTDKDNVKLREDLDSLKIVVEEIKEKHLASVETNIKELSKSVHDLSLQVTRLTTIIDERIPKTNK